MLVLGHDPRPSRGQRSGADGELMNGADILLCRHGAVRRAAWLHHFEAMSAHIGGAVDSDHSLALREIAAGDEGQQAEARLQRRQHDPHVGRHGGGVWVSDNRRDRAVDVAEQGRRARRARHGIDQCIELGLTFQDQLAHRGKPIIAAAPYVDVTPIKRMPLPVEMWSEEAGSVAANDLAAQD